MMKSLLTYLFCVLTAITSGQPMTNIKAVIDSKYAVAYDSIFINPNNIKSIRVERLKDSGTIFIDTKEGHWKYKGIEDIMKEYPTYKKQMKAKIIYPIFYVEDKPINKITDAKIDDSFYSEIIFKDLSKFTDIGLPCKNIMIIEIKLSSTKPPIHIRGDSILDLENYLKRRK